MGELPIDRDLTELLDVAASEFSGDRCLQTLSSIFQSDRRGDYRAFRETAQLVRGELADAGATGIEVIPHPADGIRRHGDWIVPQAWDAFGGELSVVSPKGMGRRIVRHPDEPLCIAMYSAPTPPEGIEADVVLWEEVAEDSDLTGKIVLTSERVRSVAERAMPNQALGIISDFAHPHAVDREARYWENYCFVPRNTSEGFAFILSPNEGQRLRSDVKAAQETAEHLKVRATVHTRLYDGQVDIVSGLLPGGTPNGDEVLLVAHLYEIGANDNSSGAATCIESLRSLRRLIEAGRLPVPKRAIRVLLCFEQYGTIAYLDMSRDRVPAIVAGLNADMVGEDQHLCGSVLTIDGTPPANPSYTNDLIARLFGRQNPRSPDLRWRETCYSIHDGFISDPMIDIPTPTLLHQPDRFYHSDADTPDKVSTETLSVVGSAVAAYAYYIAAAGADQARDLADLVARRARDRLVKRAQALADAEGARDEWAGRLAFWDYQERRALHSVFRLVGTRDARQAAHGLQASESHLTRAVGDAAQILSQDAGREVLPSAMHAEPRTDAERLAASLVPERTMFGSPTMADLPTDARREFAEITGDTFPYSTQLCSALFWADGRRSVLEVRDLLAHERGQADLSFLLDFFRFLETHGYCTIRTG